MYTNRFLLLALGLILLIGCHDKLEESFIYNPESMTSVKMIAPNFISSINTRSKLTPNNNGTSFSWKNGDIVAVYSDSKGMTNFYIDEESLSEDGTSANFNGSGFKLLENSTYYAFYPYSSSIQSLDKTAIPVSYLGQNMKSNGDFSSLGDFDYMYAKGITNNNGTVALSFQHLGCVVEYKINVPKTAVYTLVRLELKDEKKQLINSGVVDITESNPSLSTSNTCISDSIIQVGLNEKDGGINVLKDSLLTVYMMMPPQNLSTSKINIRLVDSDENWYTATVDGKNMCAGFTYHYEINDKTGGFTGKGTGLPNGEFSTELISTYTDVSPSGYEGMLLDEHVLYTSGQFGVRSIDYSNEKVPLLLGNQTIKNITNGRTDMYSRSIAIKDDYLYIPLRQSSSGSNENVKPTMRFCFENNTGDYNDLSNGDEISSNATVNAFFKKLHISSINLNQNFKVLYLYKGVYQNGYYLNTINLQGEDGTSSVLFRETFATQEDALAALTTEYSNSKGDYCKVDWSVLPKQANVFKNIKFYQRTGDFDSYKTVGTASISGSTVACPNTGLYSICMKSGNSNSNNSALLTYNLSSTMGKGFFSFWCKLDQMPSSEIEVPLTGLSGDNTMSFLATPIGMNSYSIGIRTKDRTSFGTFNLNIEQWYNFKIELSSSKVNLWYRTKEAGDWINVISQTTQNTISFNQLTTGLKTNACNAKVYFDDYYYNATDIDNVSYVNGKLAILNKKTLEVCHIYNLDVKAIDAKIYGNRLVVTCFYGFNVYDISDAANPILTYSHRVNKFKESQNCEIYENAGKIYAFICNYSQGYTIVDITDVNNVNIVYTNDYKSVIYNGENMYNKIYNFDVCISYPYAYLTNATMRSYLNTSCDRRGILTINLSDFNNPNPCFSFVPSDMVTTITAGDPRPTHIARTNNYLLINNAEKGILVFSIGANGIPTFTTSFTIPGKPCVNDIYVPYNGYVFVNDNNHGGISWPDRNIYLYKGF